MTFKIAKADFEATRALIGLAGETGCGKTLSALLLARGLVGPAGKVGMIDTEAKRSRMYARDQDVGGFDVLDLVPPFTPERYSEAIAAMEAAGYGAIVIDSATHEWSGIGGCLEQAEVIEAKTGKSGVHCWNKPKASHRRFVNRVNQTQSHVILCMRAGKKVKPGKDPDTGKAIVVESDDLVPETEKRLPFELTIFALLDQDTHLPRWKKLPRNLEGQLVDGKIITAATGAAVAKMFASGVAIDRAFEAAAARLREAAADGTRALHAAWSALEKPWQARLEDVKDECKQIAAEADRLASQTRGATPTEGTEDNPFGAEAQPDEHRRPKAEAAAGSSPAGITTAPAEGRAAAPQALAPATGATIAPGAAADLLSWCPSMPVNPKDAAFKAREIVKRLTPLSADDRMAWFRVEKHAALHQALIAQLSPEHADVKAIAKLWQDAA